MTDSTVSLARGSEPRPRDHWWIRLLVGGALTVLGVLLLANPRAAATTLALLVGLGLIVHGVDEILVVPRRTIGLVGGLASIVAGVVALAWPDATLWVVAVIAGMTCIAVGSLRITTGLLARGEPGWGWSVVAGVASAVVGVLALTWPAATAMVIAVLLGVRTLVLGLGEMVLAVEGHRAPAVQEAPSA